VYPDLLPAKFTLEDAKRVRKQQGLSPKRASRMISTWKIRKYVFQISVLKKAQAYLDKTNKK